jgi:hypothetical protein
METVIVNGDLKGLILKHQSVISIKKSSIKQASFAIKQRRYESCDLCVSMG